jgi:TonB family protein
MDNISFNNDIHLTSEELVAYGQGNLSNREMHRLELHLINCEFCNEALEGIASIEESALNRNLSSIRARTETKSSRSISISSKQWMAMAASIALIAVVSIIFYLLPKGEDTLIAEKPPIKEELLVIEDSSLKEKETEDSLQRSSQREDSLLALAEIPVARPTAREVQASEVIEEEPKSLSVSDMPDRIADLPTKKDTAFLAENIIQALDVEELSKEEDQDIAVRSKKIASPVAGAETPAASEAFIADTMLDNSSNYQAAEPDKGRRNFERYLKRNLKYPDAAKENKIEGEVILVLTINTFGSITNIDVVQSLGYGCDQEAIRLIREGPDWVPGNMNNAAIDDKVMVAVPFKL